MTPMNQFRPDPDDLLAVVQKAEARQQRGKLKIFFGMAAGVGKTYAMLEAARQLKDEGQDVVIGCVETHKRAETEALLEGLEIIPRQKVEYRGTLLEEMDTDAILARKPQWVLVDELAHTNVPGVRHVKRYQDVMELLQAGINVYTTVNVQHFESRADAVRQITGITVHETVPDSILDLADEIELIDLSPEELRKRLAEGKVYTSERIETAVNNFFRVGNLTALREMALRLTAERVDHQLQDYMSVKQIAGPWKSGERLMVAVGPSPFSERLIRWTRRMAYNLEAPWIAAYIETPESPTQVQKEQLAANLALARDLGGEIVVMVGGEVGEALLRVARQRNVTQIVVGKPLRHALHDFLRGGSLVDHLIRSSGDIDIYVVTGDKSESETRSRLPRPIQHSRWSLYALALFIVAAVTVFSLLIVPVIGYQAVGLVELLTVLLIAIYIGRGPALLAAITSALSWNFLFINPRFTLTISEPEDLILFALYFAIAIFTGNLTARLRTQERQARYNAERTLALYTLAHEIASAVNMEDVLRTAVTQIGRGFDAEVAVLLPENGKLSQQAHSSSTLQLDAKDFSVALWTFDKGKPAGRYTETLPSASAQFFPLTTSNHTIGVIGIRTRQNERLSFDQEALLETFINQVALVIERELLDEAAEQSAMLRESERLYTTLLNSISHELRTPMAVIKGMSDVILGQPADRPPPRRMLETLSRNVDILDRMIVELLDISEMSATAFSIRHDPINLEELLWNVVNGMTPEVKRAQLDVSVMARDTAKLQVMGDDQRLRWALGHLLQNSIRYTEAGGHIIITASLADNEHATIQVVDTGVGIAKKDLPHIFDRFYRGEPRTASGKLLDPRGLGQGLFVARTVTESHGGYLSVKSEVGHGSIFTMVMPVAG